MFGNGPQLIGKRRRLRDDLLELADHIAHQRLELCRGCRGYVLYRLYFCHHKRLGLDKTYQPYPVHTLSEDKTALVGHSHNLVHGCQGAHAVQVGGLGSIQARIELCRNHNRPLFTQRFNELDGTFATYRQRQDGVRKQDRIAHRQNGNEARARRAFRCRFVQGRG